MSRPLIVRRISTKIFLTKIFREIDNVSEKRSLIYRCFVEENYNCYPDVLIYARKLYCHQIQLYEVQKKLADFVLKYDNKIEKELMTEEETEKYENVFQILNDDIEDLSREKNFYEDLLKITKELLESYLEILSSQNSSEELKGYISKEFDRKKQSWCFCLDIPESMFLESLTSN